MSPAAGRDTGAGRDERAVYEIRVRGTLDAGWSAWLGGLEVEPLDGGETRLAGPIRDQAALHGLLNKIRDLGLPLLYVNRQGPAPGRGGNREDTS